MDLLIQVTATGLLTVTAMAHLGRIHNVFELTCHFRVQYFLAALVCLLAALARGSWRWATAAAITLVINLSTIIPYYGHKSCEAASATNPAKLKILLINVHHGNSHPAACLAVLNRELPNVIVAQEINQTWADALSSLTTKYSFCEVLPREDGAGIGIYSQFPYSFLPTSAPETDIRPCILLKLEVGESRISLLALHPRAPIRPGHFEKRNALLAWAGAQMQQLEPPNICIGDLNCSPWSPYYWDLLRTANLLDARTGFGLFPSWPTFLGFRVFMIPIDHCLVSPDVYAMSLRTGERIGSDHLPRIVELLLPNREYT